MKNKRIFSGIFILSLVLGVVSALVAQDEEALTIAGSPIVVPVLEKLSATVDAEVDLNVVYETMNTSAGIRAFCEESVIGVGTTRPMTLDENALCQNNDVEYMEFLVGHNILAVIANPADDFLFCLTQEEVNTIFAPSAEVTTQLWSDVDGSYPEDPLAVALMPDNTLTYVALDRLVDGDGLRRDGFFGNAEDVVATVATTEGMIGVVPLVVALANEDDVVILDVDFIDSPFGCSFPSVEAVENRFYLGADSLYLYVNKTSVDALEPLLSLVASEDSVASIESAGYSAPSPVAYDTNAAILAGDEVGRTFTQDVVGFRIPDNLSGSVTLVGSPVASTFIRTVVDNLTAQFAALTVNLNTLGEQDGLRRFCNAEVPIAIVSDVLSAERQALCEANDVVPVYFPLGTRAVVLLANEDDDYAICLTLDQITTLWDSASTESVMNWQDVGASFPDVDLTLFGISAGSFDSDLLLARAGQTTPPVRTDTELNADALYRAAATANVPGALTYMSWTDYRRVLNNNQAGIQLVAVNGTSGCVTPSEASIADGTYLLTQSAQVVVSQSALNNVAVQSLLWSFFTEANFISLERAGFVGLNFGDLPAMRESLQNAFTLASQAPEAVDEVSEDSDVTDEDGDAVVDDDDNGEDEAIEDEDSDDEDDE